MVVHFFDRPVVAGADGEHNHKLVADAGGIEAILLAMRKFDSAEDEEALIYIGARGCLVRELYKAGSFRAKGKDPYRLLARMYRTARRSAQAL